MKKLFALLLAMMMIFSLAACGEKNTTDPDKDNPGTSQSGENNDDNPNMRFGFYLLDTTLEKIDSLPKTEEGKRVVSRSIRDGAPPYHVSITIYTWSDPEAMYDGYEVYYFWNHPSNLTDKLADETFMSEYNVTEKDEDAAWAKFELKDGIGEGSYGMMTYNEIYNYVKHSAVQDIVEE